MYFQLLHGSHKEKDFKVYQTVVAKRDDRGMALDTFRPVLISDSDLVRNFGSDKFREISKEEYDKLSKKRMPSKGVSQPPPKTNENEETPFFVDEELEGGAVAKAAEKGAEDIKPKSVLGKDVTSRYPDAEDLGVRVHAHKKDKGRYIVVDNETDEILTAEPLLRSEIEDYVNSYVEA